MSLSHKLGIALTGISHFNGAAKANVSYLSGQYWSYEFTENFNGFANGTTLVGKPGWVTMWGDFSVTGGSTTPSLYAGHNWVGWQPPELTLAPGQNHEAECTLLAAAVGPGDQFVGIGVSAKAPYDLYGLLWSNSGGLYLSYYNSAVGFQSFIGTPLAGPLPAGTKFRLRTTGTGTARRLTASYDIGSGWVTPWSNFDPGAGVYMDGQFIALWGYQNLGKIWIDSLTMRRLT